MRPNAQAGTFRKSHSSRELLYCNAFSAWHAVVRVACAGRLPNSRCAHYNTLIRIA